MTPLSRALAFVGRQLARVGAPFSGSVVHRSRFCAAALPILGASTPRGPYGRDYAETFLRALSPRTSRSSAAGIRRKHKRSIPDGNAPSQCRVAWNSIARAALLLCRLQQQSGKRLGAMSYLAELLLNALMLFAVELGRVRRRGRRRRLGLNDAVWQGIGLI